MAVWCVAPSAIRADGQILPFRAYPSHVGGLAIGWRAAWPRGLTGSVNQWQSVVWNLLLVA